MSEQFKSFYRLLLPAIFFASITNANAQDPQIKFTEKLVCEINKKEMVDPTLSISNNMRHIGFRMKLGNKQVVVIDGVAGKPYDTVEIPVFSPDSKRFAYVAKENGTWFIVLDHGQQDVGSYAAIRGLQFCPDNTTLLYVADEGASQFTVINGANGNPYTRVDDNSIRFSPGGKAAFRAIKGKKEFMVFDGQEGASYERVSSPVFSLKGKHLGYVAKKEGKQFAVIDGREGLYYDSVEAVIFSDNGKHFVYHVADGGREFVVTDGVEGPRFNLVYSLLVSSNGSREIYGIALDKKNADGFLNSVVDNGKTLLTYETVVDGSLRISNDGKHTAYEAELNDEFFVVLDGDTGKHYGDVIQSTITFSPNSKRISYAGENNSKRKVNIDGVEGDGFDDVYSIWFSPNNKRVVYVARAGDKDLVVVDTIKGKPYDSVLAQGGIVFDSSSGFHFLAMQQNKVYLVEEKIK